MVEGWRYARPHNRYSREKRFYLSLGNVYRGDYRHPLAGAGQLWRTEAQREKEKELMFIGEQFRLAIGSYYEKLTRYAQALPAFAGKTTAGRSLPYGKKALAQNFS